MGLRYTRCQGGHPQFISRASPDESGSRRSMLCRWSASPWPVRCACCGRWRRARSQCAAGRRLRCARRWRRRHASRHHPRAACRAIAALPAAGCCSAGRVPDAGVAQERSPIPMCRHLGRRGGGGAGVTPTWCRGWWMARPGVGRRCRRWRWCSACRAAMGVDRPSAAHR